MPDAESDAPRVFDAAIFRHTYHPWTGRCGCGEGPFGIAEHRLHVESAMSVTPPDEHRQMHRPATGDSECTCGQWVGPMTTIPATDPRSFAAHVASALPPEKGDE